MEIHDGKEWIHGNPGTIQITIFLITIQSHQLEFTLESINKLNPNYPVLVNVIMNVAPTNRAYNQMRERCKTPYFIQLDEEYAYIEPICKKEEVLIKLKKSFIEDKKCFLYISDLFQQKLFI